MGASAFTGLTAIDYLKGFGSIAGGVGDMVSGIGQLNASSAQAQASLQSLEFAKAEAAKQDQWVKNYASMIGPINLKGYQWASDVLDEVYGSHQNATYAWGSDMNPKEVLPYGTKNYNTAVMEGIAGIVARGEETRAEKGLKEPIDSRTEAEKAQSLADRSAGIKKTAGIIQGTGEAVREAGSRDMTQTQNRLRESLAERGISPDSGVAARVESETMGDLANNINAQANTAQRQAYYEMWNRANNIITAGREDPGLLYPSLMGGKPGYRMPLKSDPAVVGSDEGTGAGYAIKPVEGTDAWVVDEATGRRYPNVYSTFWNGKEDSIGKDAWSYFGFTGPTDPAYTSQSHKLATKSYVPYESNKLRGLA